MHDLIHNIPTWVQHHSEWAWLATFLIAFTESLAIVGLFIPGSTLLAVLGVFVGLGTLPAAETFIFAIVGAIAGDILSFWLGYHYHEDIRKIWPFSRFGKLLNRGEQFFAKYGGKSVFVGRFLGPLRPTMPLIAGIMNLQPKRFLIANVASALIWAPGYIVPGILIGAGIVHITGKEAEHAFFGAIVFLVAVLSSYWLARSIMLAIYEGLYNLLQRGWDTMENHWLKWLLRDATEPHLHRQLSLAIWTIICFSLFIVLFILVATHMGVSSINIPVHHSFMAMRTETMLHIMVVVSFFGQKVVLIPTLMASFIYLMWQKNWRYACHWLIALIIAAFIAYLAKEISYSHRPGDLVNQLKTLSFPSGHVTFTLVVWGFVAYLIRERLPKEFKRIPMTALTLLTILVAFSRLYLGLHWLTDVIGGVLLGCSVLFVMVISYRRHKPNTEVKLKSFLIALGVLFFVFATLYGVKNYSMHVASYQLKAPIVLEPGPVILGNK
tara:strand:- start:72986 stop:74470 length:1485 start_codon:yes stop_codon:yes gene_type:complete